ncbi:MAG: type II toxin-antitoxin system YafO family toxin [Sedimenticola sp.]
MIEVFKSLLIEQQLTPTEFDGLVADLQQYKESGIPADYFGRDAPYDHPHTLPSVRQEEAAYLHLADDSQQWPIHRVRFYRTSDKHLVYCHGFFKEDHYLLMIILEPDAHNQARNTIPLCITWRRWPQSSESNTKSFLPISRMVG